MIKVRKKAVAPLVLLCLVMSFAFISLANAEPYIWVNCGCKLWNEPPCLACPGDQCDMARTCTGFPCTIRGRCDDTCCGLVEGETTLYSKSSFFFGVRVSTWYCGKAKWWHGYRTDPALLRWRLPYGINMTQIGLSYTNFNMTFIDLDTTLVIDTYQASITNGTFTATPNWAADWIVSHGSITVAQLPPCIITVPVVEGHVIEGNCKGNAESYTDGSDTVVVSMPTTVGGIAIPADKFGLLAPYIGLASTIVAATAATAIYVKRVKRRKENQ